MRDFVEYIIACSGIKLENSFPHYKELEYRPGENKNVNIQLTKFIKSVDNLNNRLKDLLEIAGYIFAADRYSPRGSNYAIELHSWSRRFNFHFKVRDFQFWDKDDTQYALKDALCFMTGDDDFKFTFYQAEQDFPTSLFDIEEFVPNTPENCKIALFSGGIDSLAGVIDLINNSKSEIWLASHQSGSNKTKRTQRKLYEAINQIYPDRCKHYKYQCGLSGDTSNDESQRTRPLLYMATAFVLANSYNQNEITVFENGITSINFAETQDLMNGRASRTTHPKTIALLEKLFSKISEEPFHINHPYLLKTKTDVVEILKKYDRTDLLDSSVSCSGTRKNMSDFTHCGECTQCLDRIFAVHAAEVEEYNDAGIYRFKFWKDDLTEDEIIRILNEYIRLAQNFRDQDIDSLFLSRGLEVIEAIEYMKKDNDKENIEVLFELCRRHSKQIDHATNRMRSKYDSLYEPTRPNSFYNLILGRKEYQKEIEKEDKEIDENNLEKIPSRQLKKVVIELAQELIERGLLTENMKETKAEKEITKKFNTIFRKEI